LEDKKVQAETAKLTVRRSECLTGIPLVGMDSVKAALQKFSEGVRGSSATTQQLAIDGNPFAMVMKMAYMDAGREGPFLKNLFADIEATLKGRDRYSRHYDYDGVGSFFKTTVAVTKLPNDVLVLGLNAAYVGGRVEASLAEALGVERALCWTAVNAVLPSVDGLFIADLLFIIESLAKVVDLKGLTPERAVLRMKDEIVQDGFRVSIPIFETEKFAVTMGLDNVESPMKYGNGGRTFVWKFNDNSILGPLHADWEDGTKFLDPLMKFTICAKPSDRFAPTFLISAEDKKAMRDLADTIASAFQ
jgi:hypothetical protein